MLEFFHKAFWIAEVVVGLGLLIFLHELGHFLMAKRNGVRVEVFSLGFGHAIWRFRRGETEYRISWIPLGGYVKMAGETLTDERKGEPYELTSKGAWPRLQIFAAGAIMNLLIAFPLAVLAFVVGRKEVLPVVGLPGLPESRSDMRPGDVVLEVDGTRIQNLDQYRIEMIRRSSGQTVPVKVRRGAEEKLLQVEAMSSIHHYTRPPDRLVIAVAPGSDAEKAGLQADDEIVSVNGRAVTSSRLVDEALRGSPGKPVKLGVVRRDDQWRVAREFEVTLTPKEKTWHVLPDDPHLMECRIARAITGGASWAAWKSEDLRKGDLVTRIDERPIRSWQDLKDVVESSANRPLRIEIARGPEKKAQLTLTPALNEVGLGALGLMNEETGVFAHVAPGSFYDRAGLKSGDVLNGVNRSGGTPEALTVHHLDEKRVPRLVGLRSEKEKSIAIDVKREGELVNLTLKTEPVVEGDVRALGFETYEDGRLPLATTMLFRRRPLGEAIGSGLYEPFYVGILTFEILQKLLGGRESPANLAGPVGIVQVSYRSAELSFGNFIWLLCLITVNLGIFNLLPIPILDGGHIVLLAIEKLRGRPPTEKFVAAFQYSGLLLILALVVFVTFNDIKRLVGG